MATVGVEGLKMSLTSTYTRQIFRRLFRCQFIKAVIIFA